MNLLSAACAAMTALAAAPAPAGPTAGEILRATGASGGLAVIVGCRDTDLLTALPAAAGWLVQGLDTDPAVVAAARRRLAAAGRYGPVSVDRFDGRRLPYADGLVNLLVAPGGADVPREEILRVLAPGGAAYLRGRSGPEVLRKARPADIDDWSHTLHDASNNAVGADRRVGPPRTTRWIAPPANARHHERLATISGVVSAGGRLFYILDEAPAASILLPPRWCLLARDAFSGVRLWRRAIDRWADHLQPFRNGPPQLSRRLVATKEAVYATLGLGRAVEAVDAATGRTVRTYDGTAGTEEIRHRDGVLYLVVAAGADGSAPRGGRGRRDILAVRADTGRLCWRRDAANPLPTTLAVAGGRAFYQDANAVVCLDAATGRTLWRAPRPAARQRPGFSAPTLVATEKVVLSADRAARPDPAVLAAARKRWAGWLVNEGPPGELIAFAADTGRRLWRCPAAETYHAPVDVFVVDGLVWVGQSASRTGPDFTVGRDLLTGEVRRRIDPARAFQTTMPHHRCYRNRAAGRYLIAGRTGVEFIDLLTGRALRHHWVRGVCQYGVLPCNGLLYVPPHSCACYIEAKLTGFLALSPAETPPAPARPALEKGPAFAAPLDAEPARSGSHSAWPTYRHDAARSGAAGCEVPSKLTCLWQAKLHAAPAAPVVAAGLAIVPAVDAHTVCAFDARTGRPAWRFTTAGRIDSPPTVHAGRVVFGSADGWVYCLAAGDGRLAWRFRAARGDRRIVANGQVESAWPVHGAVLARPADAAGAPPTVTFVAGRNGFLDGGMDLYRLRLDTGEVLAHRRIRTRDPDSGAQPAEPQSFHMPGALPDVLSFDGRNVFMRRLTLQPDTLETAPTRRHLYSPAGFLNGDWWHRTYWIYGTHFYSGYIGWYFAGREAPAGRLLVMDEGGIYGFGYRPDYYRGSTGRKYHLFAVDRASLPDQPPMDYRRAARDYPARAKGKQPMRFRWSRPAGLLARAMVLATGRLFLAGPPETALTSPEAFAGRLGGRLAVVSAADGTDLARYELDALPVHDGLAAADGRLYLATTDGRLLCLGAPPPGRTDPAGPASPIRPAPARGETP